MYAIRRLLAVDTALFAFAYLLGAMTYNFLFWQTGEHPPVWPPAGILLGVLVRSPKRDWPLWLLVALPPSLIAHRYGGFDVVHSLGIYAGDAIDAVLAGWIAQRASKGRFELGDLRSLAFLLVGAALAPLVGGVVGSLAVCHAFGLPFAAYYTTWWVAVFTAVVFITPAVVLWPTSRAALRASVPKRPLELMTLMLLLVLGTTLIFFLADWSFAFLTIPLLLIIAIRFGRLESAIANLILSTLTIVLAMYGLDTAQHTAVVDSLGYLEIYLSFVAIGTSLCVALVMHERNEQERARHKGESLWQGLLDHAPFAIGIRRVEDSHLAVNSVFLEWFGDPEESGSSERAEEFLPVDLIESGRSKAEGNARLDAKPVEYTAKFNDGEFHDLQVLRFAVLDEHDELSAVGALASDITEETRARRQLIQAQKMEAVGQLTGGIAHDFNNLLAIIIGNLEFFVTQFAEDAEDRPFLDDSLAAADRGAQLTRELLAFSRQQPLRPATLDLNSVITKFVPLIRRTLGEHIEIEVITGGGLWLCEADLAQLENALINLSINARDAMPDGGKLTIETRNVRLDDNYTEDLLEAVDPGQYVMIAVGDTGTGMSEEVRRKVFEPFFSTKDRNRGTGLGLAMVHGFVKQSGGHISVYSELGEGTTFKLYLPRTFAGAASEADAAKVETAPMGQHERVLLVEDEDALRKLAKTMLESLGYQVASASDGVEAVRRWDKEGPFDLLFTDVVLPGGLSGPSLAERLAKKAPDLRVLYMSGYTANGVIHHGRLDPGILLLEKPFRRAELARAVRRALESG